MKVTKMGFSLPKKGIRYQQVVGQREVQNILPLLTPAAIPKTPVHSLEPYISRTHMAVEISSYEEFLTGRHGTNHAILIFPELHLGALTKAYLRAIGTNHIQNRISNYQPDKIIRSPCLLTSTTPFLRLLSIKMPTPFLPGVAPNHKDTKCKVHKLKNVAESKPI